MDNIPAQPQTALVGLYTEQRPWGSFTVLMDLPQYKVKQIIVMPGQRLSLQMHHQREEHWMITAGQGEVTLGEEIIVCKKGDYLHIPKEAKHRIANTGTVPVEFIEVQLGEYFGEDDIIRFQDDYNRQ
jgi:mannose-6-phosphate isomerase-like protein (cupin superfamily)